MKRLMVPAAAAAALLVTACGGGGGGHSAGTSGGATTVSVRDLGGVGSVLVDRGGKALYTPEQEAGGKILCTGGCLSFWQPLMAGSGKQSAPAGGPQLGVIKRPDGGKQVTAGGKPLYTFSEDSPGKVTGDGFKDAFSGRSFTWHVVSSKGSTSGGGGMSGTSGRSSGGYGGSGY
jgi:predicted lipoprotein with Yx(FWY)xxD motif